MQHKKAPVEGDDKDDKNNDENDHGREEMKHDDEYMNDNDKIKTNLKNSSKVYYSITHTI